MRRISSGGGGLEVRPVSDRSEMGAFLGLTRRIYRDDPHWVEPLRFELKNVLDRSKHPFHQHADVEYYLAHRDGEVVGRVAAFVNHRFNEFHESKVGGFGFFESVDDPSVAKALLGAAEAWSRARGMERLHGPFNFSTNDEFCSPGVLIEGFEHPPVLLMGHTPPYYAGLMESYGLGKSMDLLSYWIDGESPPKRLVDGVERIKRRQNVTVRPLNPRDMDSDIRRIKEVYHSAWERNWGFVPMTDPEFDYLARSIRAVMDPRFCVLAEVEGEAVAFALQLPDLNQVVKHMDGRMFPFGWLKFLWYRRRVNAARVLTLGVKPGHRHRGFDSMLILHLFSEGLQAGYRGAECAWILEDNMPMRRGLERIGGRVYKVYRVYEKAVDAAP